LGEGDAKSLRKQVDEIVKLIHNVKTLDENSEDTKKWRSDVWYVLCFRHPKIVDDANAWKGDEAHIAKLIRDGLNVDNGYVSGMIKKQGINQ
jgi:hypothetical protein